MISACFRAAALALTLSAAQLAYAGNQQDAFNATGTINDSAYTGSGTATIIGLLKALYAGVGVTSLPTQGYASAVTLTRTADTNAYLANDVIGSATSSGGAVLTFADMGPAAGGEVMITSVSLEIDDTALISGETSYNLYLYSVTPPSALGDNAPFDIPSGDRTSVIHTGKIALGTPVDEGSTLLVATHGLNQQITVPVGGTIYGYLVTAGAYTPTSARVYKIKLHGTGI